MCWKMTILDWKRTSLKERAFWSWISKPCLSYLLHFTYLFFSWDTHWTWVKSSTGITGAVSVPIMPEGEFDANHTYILLPAPNTSPFDDMKHRLTKEVGVFLDCDSKTIAWLVNPEEDHCHVLRWPDAPLNIATFTKVYISLGSGEGMVQGTRKFLSFEYPAIKYLQGFNNWKQGFSLLLC